MLLSRRIKCSFVKNYYFRLFSGIRDDVREHEGAMLVFALLCMFDAMDLELNDADTVNKEFDAYLRLLKRSVPSLNECNNSLQTVVFLSERCGVVFDRDSLPVRDPVLNPRA